MKYAKNIIKILKETIVPFSLSVTYTFGKNGMGGYLDFLEEGQDPI